MFDRRKEDDMPESVIEDPVLGQRYVFRHRADEQGADFIEVEMWVEPGGGVVPHIHPDFEERFKVMSGQVTFGVGRDKVVAGPGDAAVVAPGVRHTYRNTGGELAHVVCEARPPRPELQQFLEDAAALGRAGKYTRRGLPKSFSGLLCLAVMARHYRPTTRILSPPVFLQRLVLDPFARLGERRGYRPGSFAQST
ncbi:MAG TPA: cupin domain-containing protein [Solirubrobacteraceae bacterium]